MAALTPHLRLKKSVPPIFRKLKKIKSPEPHHEHTITLVLRPKVSANSFFDDKSLMLPKRKRDNTGRQEILKAHSVNPSDLKIIQKFAERNDLEVTAVNALTREVEIKGPIGRLEKIFKIKLGHFDHKGKAIIGHKRSVYLPGKLSKIVESVIGFNTLPFTRSAVVNELSQTGVTTIAPGIIANNSDSDNFGEIGAIGFSANYWAEFYNYPSQLNGEGQTIAIISLGGGFTKEQMLVYFHIIEVPIPKIITKDVNSTNSPGQNPMLDGEVATDIQTAGAAAPGATIVVYFAENNPQGMRKALSAALTDEEHQPNIISISYGSAEGQQGNSKAEMESINQLFKLAAHLDVTVVVAAADTGSTLGTNKLEVQFPASSPYVLSCGGTAATISDDYKRITGEKVWNQVWNFMGTSQPMATGGGFSKVFKRPRYQKNQIPNDVYPTRNRGIPDVAASANPSEYGYYVRTVADAIAGGTSAAAPLWAALIARLNQQMGARGFINPDLYEIAEKFPNAFKLIKNGNNSIVSTVDEWRARKNGWDCCTGLGCPNGSNILNALKTLAAEELVENEEGSALLELPPTKIES